MKTSDMDLLLKRKNHPNCRIKALSDLLYLNGIEISPDILFILCLTYAIHIIFIKKIN